MTNHLHDLARRVEDDAFFLASSLRLYAKSERLNDAELAAALGCSVENLVRVRLCRNPGIEAEPFQRDTDLIAKRFGLRLDVLREAVRRGQVILQLRHTGGSRGMLAAARDREPSNGSGKLAGERP